jgi:hypothetical protein
MRNAPKVVREVGVHFVASMPAPVVSRLEQAVGLAPTGKRRLVTAHTLSGLLSGAKGVHPPTSVIKPCIPDFEALHDLPRELGDRLPVGNRSGLALPSMDAKVRVTSRFCDGTERPATRAVPIYATNRCGGPDPSVAGVTLTHGVQRNRKRRCCAGRPAQDTPS